MFIANQQSLVLHIDGDAFFASCEIARRPDLRGKPVVVGQERGIVTAMSYEAKAFGITRGLPIFEVRRLYPEITILSSHFNEYEIYSRRLCELISEISDTWECYSIDECFATLSGSFESIDMRCRALKDRVQKHLGITYSFGISYTKTLAKLASKLHKPDGYTLLVGHTDIIEILEKAPVGSIWGIGRQTATKMNQSGIQTAYQAAYSQSHLIDKRYAEPIHATCAELRREVRFPVGDSNPYQKSIQSTRMLVSRSNNKNLLFSELSRNTEILTRELFEKNLLTNHITFFVRGPHGEGRSIRCDLPLACYTRDFTEIVKRLDEAFNLIALDPHTEYRGTGIIAHGLLPLEMIPRDLFGLTEARLLGEDAVNQVVYAIQARYGMNSIYRGESQTSLRARTQASNHLRALDTYQSGLPLPFLGII